MPFYIQDVLHFSPSFMGLIFLAAPVFTVGLAAVSGRLALRVTCTEPPERGGLREAVPVGIRRGLDMGYR